MTTYPYPHPQPFASDYDHLPALARQALAANEDPGTLPAASRLGVLFFCGTMWGILTGFSYTTAIPAYTMFGGLTLATIIITAMTPRAIFEWMFNPIGVLIGVHGFAAIVSGIPQSSNPLAIARYVLLIPTLSLFIATARMGPAQMRALRGGFTLAGLVFVAYHMVHLDLGRLTEATYRGSGDSFMNPNSVGFISALTGISLLDFALYKPNRPSEGGRPGASSNIPFRLLLACIVVPCFILCVATKSRTATGVMLLGCGIRLYLWGWWTVFAAGLGGVAMFVLAAGVVTDFTEKVIKLFQLDDPLRKISGGSGRFEAWGAVIHYVWQHHFFLGMGPGVLGNIITDISEATNAHNAILQNLGELGIIGTLPLVAILVIAIVCSIKQRKVRASHFAIAVFAAGLAESMFETLLFSMGSPGSLQFILAVCWLGTYQPPRKNGAGAGVGAGAGADTGTSTASGNGYAGGYANGRSYAAPY